jgi:hypothetical protein
VIPVNISLKVDPNDEFYFYMSKLRQSVKPTEIKILKNLVCQIFYRMNGDNKNDLINPFTITKYTQFYADPSVSLKYILTDDNCRLSSSIYDPSSPPSVYDIFTTSGNLF